MKKTLSLFLIMVCIMGLCARPDKTIQAKATGTVYEFEQKLIYKDDIIYLKSYDDSSMAICRFHTRTGKASKIITLSKGVANIQVYNDLLYYTTFDANGAPKTYRIGLTGKQNQKLLTGKILFVDNRYAVYENNTLNRNRIYKKDLITGTVTKMAETKDQIDYVKNIGSDLYFWKYESAIRRVKLLSMKTSSQKMKLVASDICSKEEAYYTHYISDVVRLDGRLYYEYGSDQGSGNFWYGIMKEINAKGVKKLIHENMIERSICHDERKLYYWQGMEGSACLSYDTKNGKKTKFKVSVTENQAYYAMDMQSAILDWSNAKKLTVSLFQSGTNKKGLKKNYIQCSFAQNKKYSYYAEIEKLGEYYLLHMTAMDYSNPDYGWRGSLAGVTWFVADKTGKVVGSFK